MASTATTTLRMELMANGENDTTWGTKTNTNLNIIESAISGTTSVATTGGTTTLTNVDYTNDQAKKAVLDVTGTLVSNAIIVIPNAPKVYRIFNRTTGAFTVSVKTSSGTAITITQSTGAEIYCDGANVIRYATPLTDFTTGAPATASGAAASAVSVVATGNLSSTNAQAAFSELQTDIDTINSTLVSSYQPLDAGLTDIAGLAVAKGNMIIGNGTNFAALGIGTNGFVHVADSASSTGTKWSSLTPIGTVSLFYQAAAPTGWTISTAHTDHAIRCVGSSGGGAATAGTAFTSIFINRTDVAAHTHTYSGTTNGHSNDHTHSWSGFLGTATETTSSGRRYNDGTGAQPGSAVTVTTSGASSNHTHTYSGTTESTGSGMNFAVAYISVIKAAKDAY